MYKTQYLEERLADTSTTEIYSTILRQLLRLESDARNVVNSMRPDRNRLAVTFDMHVLADWIFPFFNDSRHDLSDRLAATLQGPAPTGSVVDVFLLRPAFQDLLYRFYRIAENAQTVASEKNAYDRYRKSEKEILDFMELGKGGSNNSADAHIKVQRAMAHIKDTIDSTQVASSADRALTLFGDTSRIKFHAVSEQTPARLQGLYQSIMDEMWDKRGKTDKGRAKRVNEFNYAIDTSLIIYTLQMNGESAVSANLIAEGVTKRLAERRSLSTDAAIVLLSADREAAVDPEANGSLNDVLRSIVLGVSQHREVANILAKGGSVPSKQKASYDQFLVDYFRPVVVVDGYSIQEKPIPPIEDRFDDESAFRSEASEVAELSEVVLQEIAEAGQFLLESQDYLGVDLSDEYKRMQKRFGLS